MVRLSALSGLTRTILTSPCQLSIGVSSIATIRSSTCIPAAAAAPSATTSPIKASTSGHQVVKPRSAMALPSDLSIASWVMANCRTSRSPSMVSTTIGNGASTPKDDSISAMLASLQVGVSCPSTETIRSSNWNPALSAREPGTGAPISGATPLIPIMKTSQ